MPANDDASTPPHLQLQVIGSGGEHTVVLGGELDLAASASMEAAVAQVCTNGAIAVRLDLSELAFIDSSGIRAVLAAKALCSEHGCGFLVVPGQEQVQRAFALTGLLDELGLETATS